VTRRVRQRILAVALAGMLLGACSKTTFDNTIAAGDTKPVVTTTTLPTGPISELLPVMLQAVKGLSEKVAANKGDNETASLIEHLWTAMTPEMTTSHKDLVPSFEFIVRRCRQATDRHRPADADRAYRNLQTIVDTEFPQLNS
jgi:hypothetical protein